MFTRFNGVWSGLISMMTLVVVCASVSGADSEPVTVVGLEKGFDVSHVEAVGPTTFAVVDTPTGKVLRVTVLKAAKEAGVKIKAPDGVWDFSKLVVFTLHVDNPTAEYIHINCKAFNPTTDGNKGWIQTWSSIGPGEHGTDWLTFRRLKPEWIKVELSGMRGYPWGMNSVANLGPDDPRMDPSKVANLTFYIADAVGGQTFDIRDVTINGVYYAPPTISPTLADPAKFFPFIDEFGQYIHNDWPGKTHSLAELRGRVTEEAKDLAAHPGPDNWDKYGGYAEGPTLKATGYFRVEKYQGKWWFVDPDGKLFFSAGINGVGESSSTPIEGRDNWFKQLPESQFVRSGRGSSAADFGNSNLSMKYRDGWQNKFAEITHERLRSWGINTIANWSSAAIMDLDRTPYCASIRANTPRLAVSSSRFGRLPDVFDPEYKPAIVSGLSRMSSSINDLMCIGYFVDNELSWGGDNISVAITTMQCPASQPAKVALVDGLKAKYTDIAKLNEAWGAHYASWEALLQSTEAPADLIKASPDLEAFQVLTADNYFRLTSEAIHEAAPNHLYLGCRFAQNNPIVVTAAAKYCDVVSFNIYYIKSLDDYDLPLKADKPVVCTEFHYGALDRGLFHTGLTPVANQKERADAYKSFLLSAMRHPQFVGTHWYEYRDECTTSRTYDDENFQIGFIDIADTPYPETIEASREVGQLMYPYALSQRKGAATP